MIDCQPLDKTMTAIPLALRTSEVNFTPPFSDSANFIRGGGGSFLERPNPNFDCRIKSDD